MDSPILANHWFIKYKAKKGQNTHNKFLANLVEQGHNPLAIDLLTQLIDEKTN